MKLLPIKTIAIIFLFLVSNINGQKSSVDQHLLPKKNVNKVSSLNSINQDWDIAFNHNITAISGVTGNAGVVYVDYWDEIWSTVWNTSRLDYWSIVDTTIELIDVEFDNINGVRGMTYDGQYIYSANNSDTIKITTIDPTLQGEIIAPFNVRYISFDPNADGGNGGFWIGNWSEDPTLIDRDGNILRSLDYLNLGITSIYGGAYDYFSNDGPFLWLWGQGDGRGNPQYIVQIDPSSGLPTGVRHDVMTDVGAAMDSSIAGGLYISDQLINGKIILGGILQGSSDLLFGYDISSSIIITAPPYAVTNEATNISSTTATLNGTLNPNGPTTSYIFELGTSVSYGTTITGTSSYAGFMDFDVSADVTDLSPNTTYHYRLKATNSDGTDYGDDKTFTTDGEGNPPIVITNAATNLGTTTATLNGTINPNGLNTTYIFEYGTSTSYGNSKAGSSAFTGTTNVNVNENITGLSPNTIYHFRLSATNEAGTAVGDDATFLTSATATDIDLQWKTLNILSFDWELGSTITADLMVKNNGTSASGSHESQLYLSSDNNIESTDIALGNQITFPAIPEGDSVTVSTNFTVPSNINGIYYFGAIVDVNNVISESDETNNNSARLGKIIIGYPNTLQLNSSINFNDVSESSSFRMVGLPGTVNQSISQFLSGSYNEDWVAYYDNGSNTDYLVAYDGSNTFDFSPGKGFWILSSNSFNINKSVNAVNIQNNVVSSGTYEIGYPITLHTGWNMISNPFETEVSWNSVQSFNQITESIHSFNGSFSSSSVMEPYVGYYFYNATNLTFLQIPYNPSSNLTKNVVKLNNNEPFLEVSVASKKEQTSSIKIGFNQDAHSGYDKYDHFIPPGDFEDIRISIINQQIEMPYKYLQVDYREFDKNHSYDIIVKNKTTDLLELVVKGIDGIVADAVYLVDNNLTFHNLRSTERVFHKSAADLSKLKLLIGDYEFIEANRLLFVPKSYSLGQNYPNPFNPSTIIEYTIPEKTLVELAVFNILGEKIETLFNGERSPGKYEALFEVNNLTSGIYLYRLQAGDFVEIKKMIFLK